MDARAENYKITYENGVLTVQPKPVEIKRNSESLFYYDGTPKLVTAEAIGAGERRCAYRHNRGRQPDRNRGSTPHARSPGRSGKAGNYALPEAQTFPFQIKEGAIETATVTPEYRYYCRNRRPDDPTDRLLRPSQSRFLRRMLRGCGRYADHPWRDVHDDRSAVDMRRGDHVCVADSSAQTSVYGADIGTAFPTDGKRGYYALTGGKSVINVHDADRVKHFTKLNGNADCSTGVHRSAEWRNERKWWRWRSGPHADRCGDCG